ncbi:MAG: protein-L-isoaspartate(D-aspartate) O-methyltransferase [Desulfosudaceae bacterium]
MENEDKRYLRRRQQMVDNQLASRGITDPLVLAAMRAVPRHMFVSGALQDQAYGDHPLPIGEQQTISQPYIVAEMTQALQLGEEDRVLEIGTGSGYQAAVISRIVDRIYTIERRHSLFLQSRALFDRLGYYNIVTRYSDGGRGWLDQAPFDAIIVTAGAPRVPEVLIGQLATGGRMVVPVGDQSSQQLLKLYKDQTGIRTTDLGGCRFVKLVGEHGWPEE